MKNTFRVLSGCSIAYAILAFVANSMGVIQHVTPTWYLQAVGFLVGGLVVFGATFLEGLSLPKLKLPTGESKVPDEVSLVPSKLEDMDSKYVYYLSARARHFNDEEALKLLQDLDLRFYRLHHGLKNEKTSGSTS